MNGGNPEIYYQHDIFQIGILDNGKSLETLSWVGLSKISEQPSNIKQRQYFIREKTH
jgi:hypothetical protein